MSAHTDKLQNHTFGNYHITHKLGEGGMGAVYLARDRVLERHVAIKIIAPELARDPKLMARFRVEAIAQARLNHTNIITIHSFEQNNEMYFIVMEYVEGKTLRALIEENGKFPVPQALTIVSQILDGLAVAHGKGVLHRDIKPANLFITADHSVKIGDFGIAKVEGIDGLTRIGSQLGTPLYSSPEQILGQAMGPATDIYSLGATLYEMITGVPPFESSGYELQRGHLERMPRRPSLLTGGISAELDALMMKSLAKSPEARFSSAEAFKKAIDQVLDGRTKRVSFSRPPWASFSWDMWIKKLTGNELDSRQKLLWVLVPLLIFILIIILFSE
ncbi:MAG: serine/threonine protein kinase [Candidatus Omnitrophota bacterium]